MLNLRSAGDDAKNATTFLVVRAVVNRTHRLLTAGVVGEGDLDVE